MLRREVPTPQRTSISVWLIWLAIPVCGLGGVAFVALNMSGPTSCATPIESRQLIQLGHGAKVYFTRNHQFPIGRTQMPPWPCCPDRCGAIPAQAWASDPIWAALEFAVDEPTQAHYRYESLDGKTFRATVVRDARCDGVVTTFVLEGSIDNGTPTVRLVEPPPARP